MIINIIQWGDNSFRLKCTIRLLGLDAIYFWPRAMLKGPKRGFVVVDLDLIGVESKEKCSYIVEQKMLLMEEKNFANENLVQSDIIIAWWISCRISRPCGPLLRHSMVFCGLLWPLMAVVWCFMALYSKISIWRDMYRLFSRS